MIAKKIPKELVLIISLFLFLLLLQYRHILLGETDIQPYAEKYSQSQYILGSESDQLVSDSELYVYASHAYLLGEDPTNVNFEHPPLPKYIHSLSLWVTGNPYSINIALFPLTLVVLYIFSGILISSVRLRLLATALFAIQPLFFRQAQYILFDVLLTMFIMLLFIVLHKKFTNQMIKYSLVGLIVGTIASIKYPIPFIFIIIGLVFLVMIKEKSFRFAPLSLLFFSLTYLAQYSVYFLQGNSLMEFIAFERYRFSWWTGERDMPKFLILESLFLGKHKAWWEPGTYQYTSDWNLFLPAIFVGFVASLFWIKKNFWAFLIGGFGLGMMLIFGLGSASSLRYLTLLLPFWLVVIMSCIEMILAKNS